MSEKLTLEDRINNLKQQKEEANILAIKLAGAIEVLEGLLKEEAESQFPEGD
tara:strand:+ start:333 stop:488 length:156 start_codon:yes stop_codon:yes gene_type:complete